MHTNGFLSKFRRRRQSSAPTVWWVTEDTDPIEEAYNAFIRSVYTGLPEGEEDDSTD